MTPKPFSEDQLAQQPLADYLERELGWDSLYAHNSETFGPGSLLGRSSDREVVLTRTLREKLEALNPGLPNSAYEDAVDQLAVRTASRDLVAINRENYAWLRDGVPVQFQNDAGETVQETLRVIDFDEPENNHFLCVRELRVRGEVYDKRPDLVGFVNGLPLLFVECKNINKPLKNAFDQNYKDYKNTIPHLFHHNAIVMFTNGAEAKIGSLTADWEHFHAWKRLAEDARGGVVEAETLLKGVCEKRNFLDLVENFILFDDSVGATRKILARNHQFLGVNLAVDAVRERIERKGKLGVFWHTQGAGKSYSMVMFTRKIHRKIGGDFTFLVMTDRDDLDKQIYKTFAGCGAVQDADGCRATSGEHLGQLMREHKAYVFSLIQKFNQVLEEGANYTQRDNVIVIADEAHRTQYGTLALNMRDALPKASFIGFTGTPLLKDDEVTRRVFGEYISTYPFQRATEDGATVPLYYETRGEKLQVSVGDLNERIAKKLEEFEVEDINVQQRLERDLQRDYHVITASNRLEEVARDFVEHYARSWESGKAMLVCIDKVTCVKMHDRIKFYWDKKIEELQQEAQKLGGAEYEHLQEQMNWMKETQIAVVVSEEQGEVEKFRNEGLDIIPHRKLIKEGMPLPEALHGLPQFKNMQRMDVDMAFKEQEHPFRVAIVCAMWLTGFDVPSLSTLYLDKPLKAHTLMQAIARANRVNEGKNNGWIVDYCGILQHLQKALADFAGMEGTGDEEAAPLRPDGELLRELAEAIRIASEFLAELGASLDEVIQATDFQRNAAIEKCKDAVNENDETRKRFEVMCREVFRKFKACINILPAINKYRPERDALNIIYSSLQRDREQADISGIMKELRSIVDEAIETQGERVRSPRTKDYDISAIDFELLRSEFEKTAHKKTAVQNLRQELAERLHRLLLQNPLRTDLQKHYEEIVAEYNRAKDRPAVAEIFERLLELAKKLKFEERRAMRENLSEEELAIFDLLRKPELSAREIKKIKSVTVDLLDAIKAKIERLHKWKEAESKRDEVKRTIYNRLFDEQTGLPMGFYNEDDIQEKADAVFRHIHHRYDTVPSPHYSDPAQTLH